MSQLVIVGVTKEDESDRSIDRFNFGTTVAVFTVEEGSGRNES